MEPNTTAVPEPSVEQQLREIAEQCALKLKAYRAIRLAEGKPARASEVAAIYQEDFQAAYALGLRHMREQAAECAENLFWMASYGTKRVGTPEARQTAAAIRNLPVGGEK